mmetsp:Transcript_17206/g.37020  ORF Transcript_17206/g.37020 Transcript_17206/m.37020 type:complete len:344 (-) Transcript_17206:194-1225(-)
MGAPCSRRGPAQLAAQEVAHLHSQLGQKQEQSFSSSSSFPSRPSRASDSWTAEAVASSMPGHNGPVAGVVISSTGMPEKCLESGGKVGREAFAQLAEEARELERKQEESLLRADETLRKACWDSIRLTKACSVNGRMVFVVDSVIPESLRDHIFQCLQSDAFRRTEFARPDTREFRHHVVEYNLEKMRTTELYSRVSQVVDCLFGSDPATKSQKPLQAYRVYTNAVMYGDAAFVHRDSCEDQHVTAIVYPNPDWASELGGETIFYDEAGEIAEAVEPRAGRVVLFRGCIQHKGSPPSRLFWGSRYTTAFKFAEYDDPLQPTMPARNKHVLGEDEEANSDSSPL